MKIENTQPLHTERPRYLSYAFKVAATWIILVAISFSITNPYLKDVSLPWKIEKKESFPVGLKVMENNGKEIIDIRLADQSIVKLYPNSSIRYPQIFSDSTREVYLSGDAFFEVVKKPDQPFIVHSGKLLTKVLGTSFTIRSNRLNEAVSVSVKTGRVSVYTKDRLEKDGNSYAEAILLTPNQKVVYEPTEKRMLRSLVDQPEIIVTPEALPSFNFDDTPVSQIFDQIAKSYGVNIVYDETLLKHCKLTASLENESLNHKLTVLCKLINANFTIIDARILITSHGCI